MKNKKIQAETVASLGRELFRLFWYLIFVLIMTFLVIQFVGHRTVVYGSSMSPSLEDGDQLVIEKVTYRFHGPRRFDIIVFPFEHDEGTYYIKRVIGLPGETVQILDHQIYIDGEKLEEHYGNGEMLSPGQADQPLVLGSDEYFVLGDNRNHSMDSRNPDVGLIKKSQIIGRAWVRIWPLDSISMVSGKE